MLDRKREAFGGCELNIKGRDDEELGDENGPVESVVVEETVVESAACAGCTFFDLCRNESGALCEESYEKRKDGVEEALHGYFYRASRVFLFD